jgi:hypothetical protein
MLQVEIDYELDQEFNETLRTMGIAVYGNHSCKRKVQKEIIEKALIDYIKRHKK